MKLKGNHMPDQMSAIRQDQAGGTLKIDQVAIPRPGPGEVLVKMDAAPVNPSDLALLAGGYMERSYPFTPGLEGSGTVVAAGKGLFPRLRLGKRVACSPNPGGDGTWAAYMLTSAMRVIPLPKHISQEQGSMMVVNPMTAMAFMHIARAGKHRAIINNAAASSLGKMLIRLALSQGIPLINIVRKEEQLDSLKKMGATHVLNSSSESFEEELKALAEDLGATLILDAVTGSQSSILLDAAPQGSTLLAYARLSGEAILADPGTLMRGEKKIEGFLLGNWLHTKGLLFKLVFISKVKKALNGDLSSYISQTYPLERAEEAIAHYREHMSEGKIVLKIGSD
jgi:NADPH:quinone reductase-like Zn-dependent oxidoreductase